MVCAISVWIAQILTTVLNAKTSSDQTHVGDRFEKSE